MLVEELIELLKGCDPKATVIVTSSNFELRGADVAVSQVHQYNEGHKETKTFRDAFDYEDYDKEVYSIRGGNEKVVFIG